MKLKKGFTLLETLIAMLILSSGLILLANSWSGSFLKIRKTQTATEVAALLERKMIEIELKYQGKPLESIPEEEGEDFGSDYPQYRWQMKSKDFEMPDLSNSMTAQEGGATETMITIMRQFSQQLNKSIKEVKVSIFYNGGKSEAEYSATTMFIDYNKSLGGGAGAATPAPPAEPNQ